MANLENILTAIGEPGKKTILILDELFSQKAEENLKFISNADLTAYCARNPDAKITGRSAVTQAQMLQWYEVVTVSKTQYGVSIKKGKYFNDVLELIKDKDAKIHASPAGSESPFTIA